MSIVAAKAEGAKKKATKTKRGKVASKLFILPSGRNFCSSISMIFSMPLSLVTVLFYLLPSTELV